jgi:hypothetical protein
MKIYLAGPMRGIIEFNFPAFMAMATMLRAQGHTVYNPAEHDMEHVTAGKFSLNKALAADLAWICLEADAVYLLPGWQRSKGATAEYATARALGIKTLNDGRPLDDDRI